jgi:hypothetical protein
MLLSVSMAWLDNVAHLDGPLTCHDIARVGACGAAGVVVYCGCSGLFAGMGGVHRLSVRLANVVVVWCGGDGAG